jgi:ABC-type Fe3+-hydroxamate transport system substrate-binding protein
MSDIHNLPEAFLMIRQVGQLLGRRPEAEKLTAKIEKGFAHLAAIARQAQNHRAAYFIWQEPLMAVGANTFIHELMSCCGWENVFAEDGRYPTITPSQLQTARPELILLSSEPFPFGEKHRAAFQKLCPVAQVILVDGEMFSWYGSRLVTAVSYLEQLVTAVNRTN